MWLQGKWFGQEVVERIASTVKREPAISLGALSRLVCDWLGWRGANGKPREVGCRKALLELERSGHVKLPERKQVAAFSSKARKEFEAPPVAEVRCGLDGLGEVEVVPVASRHSEESSIWKGLLGSYHYLGAGPLCGAQIRYLVRSSEFGWIGGLSFSGATRRLKSRDQWIGWSERERMANLEKVVCNSRFLILPSVQVPNLASHVLSLSLCRLRQDWQERYGYKPVLLETFVDPQKFSGTCYRAANWQEVGRTVVRKDGYANGKVSSGEKVVYVYPLVRNCRGVLRRKPRESLALRTPIGGARDWLEEEFAGARLPEGRLRRRLYQIGRDFFRQPGVLVPQACDGSEAKMKGAYRFFDNNRLDMQGLLMGHREATVARAKAEKVVLSVQDTSTLNYTAHPSTKGMGPINTKKDGGVGLILHDTMAFTVQGTPLGLLDVQCWARDPKEAGKGAKRKKLPIEQKESYKWLLSYRATVEAQELCPETMFVSVGDRESDLYELFHETTLHGDAPEVLVRAERSRNRKVIEDDQPFLWDKMANEPVAGHVEVNIPRSGSRVARTARLAIRYAPVTLSPPKGKALPPVRVWAVYAVEVEYGPEVKSPLEWMLLTTVEVTDFDDAVEKLKWYSLRWGIEVYHRVVKSGCRIEDRQLDSAESIQSCLAIDLVVAWRIFWLTKMAREKPDLPCDVFFEQDQWRVLTAVVRQAPSPDSPPSLRETVRMLAKLGGFLGRKCDGEPGPTSLWRGLERLDSMVIGYRAGYRDAQQSNRQRDGP